MNNMYFVIRSYRVISTSKKNPPVNDTNEE